VRDGLRFWKYDDLDELIAKRLSSLDEIERIVTQAKELDAQGKLENDRYRKQLELEGDLLLERVAQARKLYAHLKDVAEAERAVRGGASR